MSDENQPDRESDGNVFPDEQFMTTQWSVVLAAAAPSHSDRKTALSQLCRRYWMPLYAFLRRKGYSDSNAADLTQGFFERLLEKDYLKTVSREKGRFRSFMLTAIKHYAANERERQEAQKRGGQVKTFSMDFVAAEQWYRIEPEDEMTPESLFEKRWATSLLEHVMQKLKSSFERQDKGRLFELLKPHLISDVERMSYEAIAEELSCSTGTVKSAMHRMKKTYRAIIRSEVAQTVAEGEVEDELQHLMQILSR